MLPYVEWAARENLLCDLGSSDRCSLTAWRGWDEVEGGREVQEGGDVCMPIADSGCRVAETNTVL